MAIYRYSIDTAAHNTYHGPARYIAIRPWHFVIRGSNTVVSIFLILRVFRIRSRDIISGGVVCVKILLKWTFKWTILHLQWLKMVKSYNIEKLFLTFKLPLSSQTFYCLVIFYFAISSQIPRISNLTLYIVYYLLYCHLYC